jgi:hypothetical protein
MKIIRVRRPSNGTDRWHAISRAKGEKLRLLPNHQRLLEEDSAITLDVARGRGYRSVESRAELRRLGFSFQQALVPALLIPVHDVFGEVAFHQIRPDQPRKVDGKPIKYETPPRAQMALDVHPRIRDQLADPEDPLWITEGSRKADAAISEGLCCISLAGVWNWRGTNDYDGKTALADWEMIALNDRQVILAFDSDVMEKPEVRLALDRLAALLKRRRAIVRYALLPPGPNGAKTGLDDFLAEHSVADLEECIVDEIPRLDDLRALTPPAEEIPKILEAPEPRSYMPGYLPPGDHGLTVLVGRPMSGKTRLACHVARSWAERRRPWPIGGLRPVDRQKPPLPDSAVFLFSREQMTQQLLRTMKEIRKEAPSKKKAAPWYSKTHAFGADQIDPLARRAQTLGLKYGLGVLGNTLAAARSDGHSIGLLVIDSLSRVKPSDVDENDNTKMTEWLEALWRLAVEHTVHILLIHHMGHRDGAEDPVSAARGASAIAAVADAVWMLLPGENLVQRRLTVRGNLIPEHQQLFRVANDDHEGEVQFFRPCLASDGIDPSEFIKPGEVINNRQFGERLAEACGKESTKGSHFGSWVKKIREDLENDGRLDVGEGKGNSLAISLPEDE